MKSIRIYLRNVILRWVAPDYEGIKAKNKELKKDIHVLVQGENDREVNAVIARWKASFCLSDLIWYGDPTEKKEEFKGMYAHIIEDVTHEETKNKVDKLL